MPRLAYNTYKAEDERRRYREPISALLAYTEAQKAGV